jgi:PAS domain S-box-containing protein
MSQLARWLPLTVRLPLVLGGLLLVVIAIFGALSYREAVNTAIASSETELQLVASRLSGVVGNQLRTSRDRIAAMAASREILAFANQGVGAARPAVNALRSLARSPVDGPVIEIRDETGTLRLSAYPSDPVMGAVARAAPPPADSAVITPLFQVGPQVYFGVSAPIERRAGPPWYVIMRGRVDGRNRELSALLGSGASLLLGNRSGGLWTDLEAPAESAIVGEPVVGGEYRRDGVLRLGAMVDVDGTPFQIGAERPRADVLRSMRPLIYQMAGIGLVLLLAGAAAGWLVSRRLSRPLMQLTHDAERVAQGDGGDATRVRHGDEIVRLSDAFRTMVTRVNDTQERLRQSEEQYRMLFDLNPNPMWVYDLESLRFLAVNRAAVAKYGYRTDEFLGMTIRDIRPEADIPALEAAARIAPAARPETSYWRHRTKDGTLLDVEIRSRPLHFAGHDAELVLAADVSERNRLEARLRQSQKMEAVGRLAGGIAHDFNNVLSAVLGYSNLVLEDLPPDDPRRADLEEISQAGMRGAALTRQLLMFSRPQVAERQVLDLNAIIVGVRKMLARIIGEDIRVETRLAEPIGRVRMDPGHLEQIVMNLALNARDAMPEGGQLLIETSEVELDELRHGGSRLLPAGRYVMIAVSDTGIGIPREHQARIFEPFFTTKPPGEGTGLGLSTVYGIVQQNAGSIIVYSEPGHGATFKVYLPSVDAPLLTAEGAQQPARPRAERAERILFVEDEPALLKVGCEILTRAGYRVTGMPGGEEALAWLAEHPGGIDLLATDMVMPGLGGRELVNRIRTTQPAVRVLFMSGYTDDAVMQRGIHESGTAFLQKPFSADTLTRKIRSVLDGTADA